MLEIEQRLIFPWRAILVAFGGGDPGTFLLEETTPQPIGTRISACLTACKIAVTGYDGRIARQQLEFYSDDIVRPVVPFQCPGICSLCDYDWFAIAFCEVNQVGLHHLNRAVPRGVVGQAGDIKIDTLGDQGMHHIVSVIMHRLH